MPAQNNIPLLASFTAGILTFISPCVLPLMPAYISFITGSSIEELKSEKNAFKRTFLSALFFVMGFSFVFILLGASASWFGGIIGRHKDIIRYVGGAVVIIFGLHIAGIFKINFLYREKRLQLENVKVGFIGSFFVGLAFAVGWTPCCGPILGSILVLASVQETVSKGILLLVFYSLGMGIPLLATALFINWALRFFEGIKKYYRYVEIASGALLIAVGILLIFNKFNAFAGIIAGIIG